MADKDIKKRQGFAGQKLIVMPKTIITDFLLKDPITRQIYITDIGYYPKARYHYVERPAGISQHIIIYCDEGYGWLEINKQRIEVLPSQYIVIPANTPHKYAAHSTKPWSIYWLHFKGELAAYTVELILRNTENYRPNLMYNESRIKLFSNIYDNLEKGYSSDVLRYTNMIFFHFLSSLIYEEKSHLADKKKESEIVRQTIETMQQKINTVLKLSDLANLINLSVSHFSAVFRSKTGYSPIEYFNHLKVQKACQYLSFTNMPIKELAITLGIDDQYYFSRMFTKLMGVSPTEYRKKNNNTI